MAIPEGLRTSLNSIRETSIQNNTLYHRYVPEILPTSDIGSFASPILDNPNVMNEFMNTLVQRIVYTQVDIKLFNNPLRVLEGDRIPLGSIGQEIFINPADYMGFPNQSGISVFYDGTPINPPVPTPQSKNSLKWLKIKSRKIRINW